jgi:hypothetical protein
MRIDLSNAAEATSSLVACSSGGRFIAGDSTVGSINSPDGLNFHRNLPGEIRADTGVQRHEFTAIAGAVV